MRKQIPHVDEILEIIVHDLHSFFKTLPLYFIYIYFNPSIIINCTTLIY